ncbi:MAG: hypothetical protein WEA81_02090 [Dehalococcoidia bacterium]
MPDDTYGPKVYHKQQGDELVVASGGKITQEAAGSLVQPLAIKTASYTVLASESGTVFVAVAADLVFTLPATAAGLRYTFALGPAGLSAGAGLSISPAAADAIHGNGLTSVDNKDLINTGATDREGDMVELVADGVDGWFIVSVNGTWAKEA